MDFGNRNQRGTELKLRESPRSPREQHSTLRKEPRITLGETLNIKVASPLFSSERSYEEGNSNNYDVEEFDLVQPQVIGATVVSSKGKMQPTDIPI